MYRAAHHRRTALIAAAGAAVLLLGLVVWLFSGDDEPAPAARPPIAAPTATAAPTTGQAEPSPSEAAEPTASTPAPTTAAPQRPPQPAELIAALAAVVDGLEDSDELDDDGADALNRRLEQAADRLSRGDAKGASRKIDEFTKKLRDLRKDDDLSGDAFELLTSGAGQIRAALPPR